MDIKRHGNKISIRCVLIFINCVELFDHLTSRFQDAFSFTFYWSRRIKKMFSTSTQIFVFKAYYIPYICRLKSHKHKGKPNILYVLYNIKN